MTGGRGTSSGAFRLLWSAATATSLGDGIRLVALPLLAVRTVDSPALVASVVAAGYLPAIVFGSFAGTIADRVRIPRLLVGTHVVRALTLLALAGVVVLSQASLPWLWVTALVYGTCEALADPAATALLPRIVPTRELARANARLQAGQSAAEDFVGRALGGILFAIAAALPVLINAALLVLAAVLALRLPRASEVERSQAVRTEGFLMSWWAGLRTVASTGLLRSTALLIGGWNLSYGAYTGIAVVYAVQTLHAGASGVGLLLSAAAVGSLSATFLTLRLIAVTGAATTATVTVTLSAAAMLGLASAPTGWVAAPLIALDGFAIMAWNILSVSARQAVIPRELLGRATSVTRVLASAAVPAGAALGGLVAQSMGPPAALLAGAGTVLVTGAVALPGLVPILRRIWPRGADGPSIAR
ncbi:MFS transporter [Naasia aerilata]|uniref:MFS transporter n=1 Tax=Naasia aerilata TaxID=1162966 RepID=A0ABN6XS29_9MICO|nr:MFS transporter [Naasia aerilata]BDZ46471.1 MFS transporter [Naasia aerilata]